MTRLLSASNSPWRSRIATGLYVSVLVLMILSSATAQKKKKNKNNDADASTASSTDVSEDETSTGPPLTGDPQKDYIHDPNLPHELIGYDLSDYPFYKRVPKEGHNFTCDGRHDGFYASVPHKCQVYYNCLFGQRYDFLCANYTVFDQVNFICHYASEVDCASSERYFGRNEELYVTTTTTTPAPRVIYVDRPRPRPLRPLNIRRPLPPRRRQRPQVRVASKNDAAAPETDAGGTKGAESLDYYDNADYYNDYYDDYYYDDAETAVQTTTTSTTTMARPVRRRPNRPGSGPRRGGGGGRRRGGGGGGGGETRRQRPRQRAGAGQGGGRRRRIRTSTTTTEAAPVLDYYDDYYDDYYEYDTPAAQSEPAQPAEAAATTTTKPKSGPRSKPGQSRRPSFKRAQNAAPAVEPVSIEPTLPPAAVETAVEESVIDEFDYIDADVSPSQAEAPLEDARQINRRGRPTVQRIRTRPVNSRGFAVEEAAEPPIEPDAPLEPEVINSEPQEENRRGNAGGSLKDRRQRLGLSRRGPATEAVEVAPLEPEEEVPVRQPGRGFGGRRPRP